MTAVIVIGFILAGLGLTAAWVGGAIWLLVRSRRHVANAAYAYALATLALGCLVASLPWLGWAGMMALSAERAKAARVPTPLRVETTEYAFEKSSGLGMPGDNETGFVVYHLTPESAEWARRSSFIRPTMDGEGQWLQTPVIAKRYKSQWHPHDGQHMGFDDPHATSVEEYLDRYGFDIPVANVWLRRADRLINSTGSLYRYGRGGSVTLLDRKSARVYFFYAG